MSITRCEFSSFRQRLETTASNEMNYTYSSKNRSKLKNTQIANLEKILKLDEFNKIFFASKLHFISIIRFISKLSLSIRSDVSSETIRIWWFSLPHPERFAVLDDINQKNLPQRRICSTPLAFSASSGMPLARLMP